MLSDYFSDFFVTLPAAKFYFSELFCANKQKLGICLELKDTVLHCVCLSPSYEITVMSCNDDQLKML